MKKASIIAVLVLAAGGAAASYLPLDFLQPSIERALARALGRRVEVGRVHLTFLNGPGVSLDAVTIHEDPRAGIEPFAYAETVEARLDLLALLRGRLGISSLRFNDASLNLVKPDNQPWNFQMLLAGPASAPAASADAAASVPAIRMRTGRVNIKYGQTKSVLFFDDVDFDVSPAGDHMDLRFSGVPARTDRPLRNLEHFFIRGTYQPSAAARQLRLSAELEPSPMDAVARLFVADIFPLNGSLSANAEIVGPPSDLKINGEARLDTGAKWSYQGSLSLPDQQLQLKSAVQTGEASENAMVPIQIHVWDLLKVPHWEVELQQAPVETFLGIARRLGAPIPDPQETKGQIDGTMAYRGPEGIEGKFELRDISYESKSARSAATRTGVPAAATEPFQLRIPQTAISIQHGVASFGPTSVRLNSSNTADVSGSYNLGTWTGAGLKVTSKNLDLGILNAHALSSVPLISRASSGIWRGTLHYAGADAGWQGAFELDATTIALDGFAQPLIVQSAAVNVQGDRVDVRRFAGRLGKIPVTGEYHWSQQGSQHAIEPHTFRLQAGEIPVADLEALLSPSLSRSGGFLSRTLGIGSPRPAPDWLGRRQAKGNVTMQLNGAQGHRLMLDRALVNWTGTKVVVSAGDAQTGRALFDDAALNGELEVNLAGAQPAFRYIGAIAGAAYKGGLVDADGEWSASGSGADFWPSMKSEGDFQARGILFSPEAALSEASGKFEFHVAGGAPVLTLSGVEATRSGVPVSGSGSTEAGSTLVLELSGGGHTMRYGSPLAPPSAPPRPLKTSTGGAAPAFTATTK